MFKNLVIKEIYYASVSFVAFNSMIKIKQPVWYRINNFNGFMWNVRFVKNQIWNINLNLAR